MKPVKCWAIVRHDGSLLWNGGELPLFGTKADCSDVAAKFTGHPRWPTSDLQVVRVEIRELLKKRKAK